MRFSLRRIALFAFIVSSRLIAESAGAPLRVGVETELEPVSFVGSDGKPTGFAVEMMSALSREMDLPIEFVVRPRVEMFNEFEAGRIDVLVNALADQRRRMTYAFSVPHLEITGSVFVRQGVRPVHTLDDVRRLRIAAISNNYTYEYLVRNDLTRQVVPVTTQREALIAVSEGRADAAIGTGLLGANNLRKQHISNVDVAEVELPGLVYRFRMAVHAGDAAHLGVINDGLMRLRANGTYDRLYEKWIGPLERRPLSWKDLRPYFVPVALLAFAGLAALLWQRRLVQQLSEQAEQLRQTQQLLRQSAQLLTQTQAVAGIGGWEIDPQTRELNWTDETYRIHDTTPTEFRPTIARVQELYEAESRRLIDTAIRDALEQGKAFDLELQLVTTKQRKVHVRAVGRVERDQGRVAKVYGWLHDISAERAAAAERERLQAKMLESQKLESLGVLAGGIAHDFNNLLTGILLNAGLARAARDEDEQELMHIEAAANRASDLCRQLLAYAGRGRFTIEPIDISQLVHDTARLLELSISKKARLRLDLGANLPAVEADPSQIRQIVMNLVLNASDSLGDASGEIRVRTFVGRPLPEEDELMHSFDLPDGECVCVEAADTGCGMDRATLAHIFDPFFTTKASGHGLGLAAVLGIVRTHHGALTVKSAPKVGTTFRLFLPASKEPAKPRRPIQKGRSQAPASGCVLIADDEPIIRATAGSMLRQQGYETELAVDGEDALQRFRARPNGFVAILLDLTMPGLNGAEVLREIRRLNPQARVLLMSGFSNEEIVSRLRDQGSVAVLPKPFTHEALLDRLTSLLGGG